MKHVGCSKNMAWWKRLKKEQINIPIEYFFGDKLLKVSQAKDHDTDDVSTVLSKIAGSYLSAPRARVHLLQLADDIDCGHVKRGL